MADELTAQYLALAKAQNEDFRELAKGQAEVRQQTALNTQALLSLGQRVDKLEGLYSQVSRIDKQLSNLGVRIGIYVAVASTLLTVAMWAVRTFLI